MNNKNEKSTEEAPVKKHKFIGSTVALVFGWLCLLRGIGGVAIQSLSTEEWSTEHSMGVAGFVMILGTTAYRSAKRRKLGIKPDAISSRILEISLLLLCLLAVTLLRDLPDRFYDNPLFLVIIPAWVFIAYGFAHFKQSEVEL